MELMIWRTCTHSNQTTENHIFPRKLYLFSIMDAKDTDLIHVAKSNKKTLLEKYDIPVEHLSYEHISECEDAKKLEHIVTILRSGEEGYYPDLTRHAEERLATVKPTSIILRKSEPAITRSMLQPTECKELDKDINNWTSEMQSREKDLEDGKVTLINDPIPRPDIRQFKTDSLNKNTVINFKDNKKLKRIASCDYSAWDKYDVDTELNKLDIRDEQKRAEAKRFQQKQKELMEKKKLEKETIINKSSLTGTELNIMAEEEREKGNEAFRAKDYKEALEHYNSSIKMDSNITAYNNRAITFIKLQRYKDAVKDCNTVLDMDSRNIKALLRRTNALEHLERLPEALIDYETILKLEPNNPIAIAGVKKLRKPCESRKVRMTIEEQEENANEKPQSNGIEKNKHRNSQFESRLNIENRICYCDRAPGPSQNSKHRPHLKGNYCPVTENIEKVSIKNNNPKKFESPLFATNPLNSTQEKRRSFEFTKPKSIFSCAMPPKQTNSVMIEELPNEYDDTSSIKVKSKFNETNANNCNSNGIFEDTRYKYNCREIIPEKTKLNNCEKNKNFCETPNVQLSPRKIEVDNRYENKTSKPEKYTLENFDNIESGYEFMRMWQSLKDDTSLETHAQLLRCLNADKVDEGNELDGSMFSTILHCLDRHFCTSNDVKLLDNFLKSFSRVKRFSIINMFMSAEDKRVMNNILNFLEEHGTSEVSSLRQIYCI